MKSAIYGIAFMLAFSFVGFHHARETFAKSVHETDKVSGDWNGTVEAMGTKVAFQINFKLEGEKVTGTVESGHTGAGKINGTWKNGKLEFTANFAKHEPISFKGELKNEKITGEYATEGRVEKWEAVRKVTSASSTNKMNIESISGEWNAAFTAQDMSAPITLKLNTEGEKLSGSFFSDHLGTGSIEDGTWTDNKLSFTIKIPQATIKVKGILKDGKLTGDFDAGQMTGKWEAKRK